MAYIKDKIKYYKNKREELKNELANDFLSLSEEEIHEYVNIQSLDELFSVLTIYSGIGVTTYSSLLIYTILNDNNLKYDLLNIANNGLMPITNDINNDSLYKYLPLMILICSVLFTKLSDAKKEINNIKKSLKENEPKLLGYKYTEYADK